MKAQVAAVIAHRWQVPDALQNIHIQPLPGGLESAVVVVSIADEVRPASVPRHLVIKELRAGFEREAKIYQLLWRHMPEPPAVHLLGVEMLDRTTYLLLEDARPVSSWPWSDISSAAAVCRELGRLHDSAALPTTPFSWDYETTLARSAQTTVDLATSARDAAGRRYWRRLGDLRRVVTALPAMRSRLLGGDTVVIHGDVHPGNALLRSGHPDPNVVLIDWGRARLGSPLEDVASWLHSLGCWEPQARRRHDTLMRVYLDSRRVQRPFSPRVREDYWFAAVSNGLSGAIRYHLAVVADAASTEPARYASRRALAAWERVVRHGASLLSTNAGRCM